MFVSLIHSTLLPLFCVCTIPSLPFPLSTIYILEVIILSLLCTSYLYISTWISCTVINQLFLVYSKHDSCVYDCLL